MFVLSFTCSSAPPGLSPGGRHYNNNNPLPPNPLAPASSLQSPPAYGAVVWVAQGLRPSDQGREFSHPTKGASLAWFLPVFMVANYRQKRVTVIMTIITVIMIIIIVIMPTPVSR